MINIPINAKVNCSDGHAGTSTYIIINPVNQQVTDVVVQEFLHGYAEERIVPASAITETTAKSITLSCTKEELDKMQPFTESGYVQTPEGSNVLLAPYVTPLNLEYTQTATENVPAQALVVRRNMSVEATDGHLGKIHELVVDPDNFQVTHMLIKKGHLFKKDVVIPISHITHGDEYTIYLDLDKTAVKNLPSVDIQRHYQADAS